MVAKTRRGARKGRSTRRATRAAKRGGGGGVWGCISGICTSRAKDTTKAQIIAMVRKLKWTVTESESPMDAFCTHSKTKYKTQIKKVKDDNGDTYWVYPGTECNAVLDYSAIERETKAPTGKKLAAHESNIPGVNVLPDSEYYKYLIDHGMSFAM